MKIGFTCGAFDLLHAGHIMMLEKAKSMCDYLSVGLQTNPKIDRPKKNKPVQSLFERLIQLKACRYVDQVIVYETEQDLEDILYSKPINIRILGMEYLDKPITGKEICERRNIELLYVDRNHRFSSTELRNRIKNA